jgi:hypothetical protein
MRMEPREPIGIGFLVYIKNTKNAKYLSFSLFVGKCDLYTFFSIRGRKYGADWFPSVPAIVCGLSSVDYIGNRSGMIGSPTGSLFNHHHGKGIFYQRKQRGFPKGHGKLSYALVIG